VLGIRLAGWNAVEDCRTICVYVYSYGVFHMKNIQTIRKEILFPTPIAETTHLYDNSTNTASV
jgi:hypothetical protein